MKTTIPGYIQRHLDTQAQSGLSIASYCEKYSISQSTFYNWRRRYQPKPVTEHDLLPVFQEIGAINTPHPAYDIHFPSGITVSVHCGATASELQMIVDCIGRVRGC